MTDFSPSIFSQKIKIQTKEFSQLVKINFRCLQCFGICQHFQNCVTNFLFLKILIRNMKPVDIWNHNCPLKICWIFITVMFLIKTTVPIKDPQNFTLKNLLLGLLFKICRDNSQELFFQHSLFTKNSSHQKSGVLRQLYSQFHFSFSPKFPFIIIWIFPYWLWLL